MSSRLRANRAVWSFGPEVDAFVEGSSSPSDLYVPEYIDDGPAWSKLASILTTIASGSGGKATLFRTQERTFVLIFARTAS